MIDYHYQPLFGSGLRPGRGSQVSVNRREQDEVGVFTGIQPNMQRSQSTWGNRARSPGDGKSYCESGKKERYAEEEVVEKDESDLAFVPGEFDKVEGNEIAQEERGENGQGIEQRAPREEFIPVHGFVSFKKRQKRPARPVAHEGNADDQKGEVVLLGYGEIPGQG